ncbi:MAG: Type 1 glutamine amidotransferase-like domain-containing protein [Chitinophagaceae bacterium]|nr:Type 1 glutamine amidotransferase-like domain-containing protein [Oligoflexus sp.]
MGTILLTSTGFRHKVPRETFESLVIDVCGRSPHIVVIPSGAPAKQRGLEELMNYLNTLSNHATVLDLHTQKPEVILDYDVCILGGGSPYVLLTLLRKKGDAILRKFLLEDKLLVGISGGAMVLGKDVAITPLIHPSLPKPLDFDFKGLGYIKQNIFPHFDRYALGFYNDRKKSVDDWLASNEYLGICDEECVLASYP